MRATPLVSLILLIAGCGGPGPADTTASGDTEGTHGGDDHAAGHPGADHHHHGQGHQHDFSDVERFARIFDAPDRADWQRPEEVVGLMQIEPGMTVVDLGAGTGYFLPYLRAAVGEQGCVVALDVEANMVTHMQNRIAEAGWQNVVARTVAPDDAGLPPGSVDRILVVDTWHHLASRETYAGGLGTALGTTAGGHLTIVDFTMDAPHGPPPAMRLRAEAVTAELQAAGLTARTLDETLPHQWVVDGEAASGESPRVDVCAALRGDG